MNLWARKSPSNVEDNGNVIAFPLSFSLCFPYVQHLYSQSITDADKRMLGPAKPNG